MISLAPAEVGGNERIKKAPLKRGYELGIKDSNFD